MLRRLPVTAVVVACLAALSMSVAAVAKTKLVTPTITGIAPSKLKIGNKLTIRGKNFVPGKLKNTVVFLRARARPLFVRADSATSTRITITIPEKLLPFLSVRGGQPVATRFQLRVLAKRFGLSFTSSKLSPVISPSDGGITNVTPNCKPDYTVGSQKDVDGDGLTDPLEKTLGLDACKADTDGDGVTDGFEYESALDLNSRALPYPGKRPYPNPLDPGDANTDYDGDGLTNIDEYSAWVRYGGSKFPLTYSDGTQNTGGPQAIPPGRGYFDYNNNGTLGDDERDVDNDGLPNWMEAHGGMSGNAWWLSEAGYKKEPKYGVEFAGTDWLDPDTDGDSLPDGPDDNDFDGYNNIVEMDRTQGTLWVQPFNPCLPDYKSRTCAVRHPAPESSWPPFGVDEAGFVVADGIPPAIPLTCAASPVRCDHH
jgi:hypothetical protein